jgi:hypothetical protein
MSKFDTLPAEVREKALSDVFCIRCQKSFRMESFTEREFRGTLILEGKCPECGEAAAKPVSLSEAR